MSILSFRKKAVLDLGEKSPKSSKAEKASNVAEVDLTPTEQPTEQPELTGEPTDAPAVQ
jgi:hypothetical protein